MLTTEHLTKHYKGTEKGITDISLTVGSGEICAFIGHNGAGKTTLLKCISGIHGYDSGKVTVNGIDMASDPIGCKRSIAYIPDDPQLYEYLTGIQYLDFIADIFGVSSADRSLRVREYADAFELTPSLGDLISGYSHGMKQKLAVISALIHEPQLLILDEPFVGLDPKAASVLKKLMRSVAERGGAVFFSTHVLEVAEKLCDKVAMIKQGRLLASGSMSDILGGGSLEDVFMEALDDKTDDNAH